MKILLPTTPKFLRGRLRFIRLRLLGQKGNVLVVGNNQPRFRKRPKISSKLANFILFFSSVLTIVAGVAIFAPDLYFQVFPNQVNNQIVPTQAEIEQTKSPVKEIKKYQPEVDQSLPAGNWLVIPRIGVRSEMLATATADEALAEGIWWVPDFGKPGDDLPIILVAHRYGYKWWWKTDYWKYNSFYLLPELESGDRVEVIVEKRKWVYQIYKAEEGEQVSDYSADLILYTCKYLNSPIKHFRYARLVDPTLNSQNQ